MKKIFILCLLLLPTSLSPMFRLTTATLCLWQNFLNLPREIGIQQAMSILKDPKLCDVSLITSELVHPKVVRALCNAAQNKTDIKIIIPKHYIQDDNSYAALAELRKHGIRIQRPLELSPKPLKYSSLCLNHENFGKSLWFCDAPLSIEGLHNRETEFWINMNHTDITKWLKAFNAEWKNLTSYK